MLTRTSSCLPALPSLGRTFVFMVANWQLYLQVLCLCFRQNGPGRPGRSKNGKVQKFFPSLGFALYLGRRRSVWGGKTSLGNFTYLSLARVVSRCLPYIATEEADIQYYCLWSLWQRNLISYHMTMMTTDGLPSMIA